MMNTWTQEFLFGASLLLHAFEDPFLFTLLVTTSVLFIGYVSKHDGLAFFITIAVTFSLTQMLKALFAIPRPADALVSLDSYRFPSLHASIGAALIVSFLIYGWRQYPSYAPRSLLVIVAAGSIAFVAWSRVYLGVHYPIDVIAGALLGTVVSFAVHSLARRYFVVQ